MMKNKSLVTLFVLTFMGAQSIFATSASYRIEGTLSSNFWNPGYNPVADSGYQWSGSIFTLSFSYDTTGFTTDPAFPSSSFGYGVGSSFKFETDSGISIESTGPFDINLEHLTLQNFANASLSSANLNSNLNIEKFSMSLNASTSGTPLDVNLNDHENLIFVKQPIDPENQPTIHFSVSSPSQGEGASNYSPGHAINTFTQLSPQSVPDMASTGLMMLLGLSLLGFIRWRKKNSKNA